MGSFGPRTARIPAALSGGNLSTLAHIRHTTISRSASLVIFLSDAHRQHGVLHNNFLWWKSLRVTGDAPPRPACHYSALLGLPLQPRASIYVFTEIVHGPPQCLRPPATSEDPYRCPWHRPTQTDTDRHIRIPSHRWSALGQVECLGNCSGWLLGDQWVSKVRRGKVAVLNRRKWRWPERPTPNVPVMIFIARCPRALVTSCQGRRCMSSDVSLTP